MNVTHLHDQQARHANKKYPAGNAIHPNVMNADGTTTDNSFRHSNENDDAHTI